MDWLSAFAFSPPGFWLAFAGGFLVLELISGSGWLLWPSTSAGITSLLAMAAPQRVGVQIVVFAAATVVSTFVARRLMNGASNPPRRQDINDAATQLVGKTGEVTHKFAHGKGRVFVSGKEWAADLDSPMEVEVGAPVQVLELVSSSRIRVAPLPAPSAR